MHYARRRVPPGTATCGCVVVQVSLYSCALPIQRTFFRTPPDEQQLCADSGERRRLFLHAWQIIVPLRLLMPEAGVRAGEGARLYPVVPCALLDAQEVGVT